MERLWNANYIRVMLTNFSLFFALYLITPLLPIYLTETFSASKDMIGFVLSGYIVMGLLARPLSGYMVDCFPRKRVLLVCLFCFFILFGGYLLAGSLVLFALVRTLHGAPFGASTVANSTMAIDVLPSSRRNEGIGFYGLSNNLASAVAPMVGVYLYHEVKSFDALFWLAFIVAGIGFVGATTVRPIQKQIVKGRQKLSLDRFFLLRGWHIALVVSLCGFCWGEMSNYVALYGKEQLGITTGTGTFFLLLSAGLIVSRLWGNKQLREGHLMHNATEGVVLSTIGYLLFIVYPSPYLYYASAVFIGLGNGHIWPAFQNMIIGIAHHDERGTANSTILTSWDAGMGLGILLGGVVAEHWGFASTFWLMAAVHIVCLLMFLALFRGHKKQA